MRRGDVVLWSNADPYAAHTVTFTSGAPAPGFAEPRPQPSGPPLLVVPAAVLGPAGGTTYSGRGYLNSGFLFPGDAFALTIDAPPGTYAYVCVIHLESFGHAGVITVVE